MAIVGKDTLNNQARSMKIAGRKARDEAYAARGRSRAGQPK